MWLNQTFNQRVAGSNPTELTSKIKAFGSFVESLIFYLYTYCIPNRKILYLLTDSITLIKSPNTIY